MNPDWVWLVGAALFAADWKGAEALIEDARKAGYDPDALERLLALARRQAAREVRAKGGSDG